MAPLDNSVMAAMSIIRLGYVHSGILRYIISARYIPDKKRQCRNLLFPYPWQLDLLKLLVFKPMIGSYSSPEISSHHAHHPATNSEGIAASIFHARMK